MRGDVEELLHRLGASTEQRRSQFQDGFADFATRHDLEDWEGWYSAYDAETYAAVLEQIGEEDVVLDVGAGDLRLALQIAGRARRVYALEVNPRVVGAALSTVGFDLPRNLHVICANARDVAFPPGITVAVLLMRHCRHFGQYVERLEAVGCRRLMTNARWKNGVELVDLEAQPLPLESVEEGWYACRCGAVGYVGSGDAAADPPLEVASCPRCRSRTSQ
jgi:SAM-dependent methyltransferase